MKFSEPDYWGHHKVHPYLFIYQRLPVCQCILLYSWGGKEFTSSKYLWHKR